MAQHAGGIKASVMIGVGAAFPFPPGHDQAGPEEEQVEVDVLVAK